MKREFKLQQRKNQNAVNKLPCTIDGDSHTKHVMLGTRPAVLLACTLQIKRKSFKLLDAAQQISATQHSKVYVPLEYNNFILLFLIHVCSQ